MTIDQHIGFGLVISRRQDQRLYNPDLANGGEMRLYLSICRMLADTLRIGMISAKGSTMTRR